MPLAIRPAPGDLGREPMETESKRPANTQHEGRFQTGPKGPFALDAWPVERGNSRPKCRSGVQRLARVESTTREVGQICPWRARTARRRRDIACRIFKAHAR